MQFPPPPRLPWSPKRVKPSEASILRTWPRLRKRGKSESNQDVIGCPGGRVWKHFAQDLLPYDGTESAKLLMGEVCVDAVQWRQLFGLNINCYFFVNEIIPTDNNRIVIDAQNDK